MTASAHARDLLTIAVSAADAKQAEELVALDISDVSPFADVYLLASGGNERQVISIAAEIEDRLIDGGAKPLRREGRSEGRWILLDFGDLVVHVFHTDERAFYSLERLWSDCPVLTINA